MSHTDKDMPYWVTAKRWEPVHWNCPHDTQWWLGVREPRRDCDLPDGPDTTRDRPRFSRRRQPPQCRWEPVYTGRPCGHVPNWFVQHVWTNRERVAVRDQCRRAAAEYRATGEVEVVPSVRQHHHGAQWDWE